MKSSLRIVNIGLKVNLAAAPVYLLLGLAYLLREHVPGWRRPGPLPFETGGSV